MPLRYLILARDDRAPTDAWLVEMAARSDLSIVSQGPGAIVFANAPADILAFTSGQGAVVGKLFHRHGHPSQVRALSPDAETTIAASAGRHLVDRYWGSYVACLDTADGVCVLRDPSGGLPCYHARFDGGHAFTSDACILTDLSLVQTSIDWRMLGRTLLFHHLPSARTAIVGIDQILGGCALSIRGGVSEARQYWSPWDFLVPREVQRAQTSEDRLKRAVSHTIAAFGSCYTRPLVGLSGGLDSSIVAACLRGAGANLACVTLMTDDPLGDERRYADEVAQALSAAMIVRPYRYDAIDLDRSVASGVPMPCGKSQEQAYNAAIVSAVAELGADAFFVGAGGDNVFYSTNSARPLVDRYDADGLSRGTVHTLGDIIAITGASPWRVLREVHRLTHPRETGIRWTPLPDYLCRDFVEAELPGPIEHPWFKEDRAIPSGKLGHLKLLLRALNHIEHRDKSLAVPMISPLLSQPIVETCLSIPSWEFVAGGVDRAVARHAFASVLPRTIADRQGKGSPDGFIGQFLARNRDAIASRLLEGMLVAQGLLDRPALERALDPRFKLAEGDGPRLMSLIDAEAWARHWSKSAASG